jgi:hypothetical protein
MLLWSSLSLRAVGEVFDARDANGMILPAPQLRSGNRSFQRVVIVIPIAICDQS